MSLLWAVIGLLAALAKAFPAAARIAADIKHALFVVMSKYGDAEAARRLAEKRAANRAAIDSVLRPPSNPP